MTNTLSGLDSSRAGMTPEGSLAQPYLDQKAGRPLSVLKSALFQQVNTAQKLPDFELHAGQVPLRGVAALVIQGGGVERLAGLAIEDGGPEAAGRLVAGLEVHLRLVHVPRTTGNPGDDLAAGGHRQAQGQVDIVDEVPV